MRIISANLNGVRSAHGKGFFIWIATQDADLVCVQVLLAMSAELAAEMRSLAGLTGYFHHALM